MQGDNGFEFVVSLVVAIKVGVWLELGLGLG